MVKAGVQQISLPDVYKMFKTASDEDKIKLMNTYANLGERLGEYDKDIDYRRRYGDKDALNEKMYTEGIGDALGSAWDYTKQGAETAWDYAKKGAKKGAESLRDLVMRDVAVNDLVRGDEYIDEEQEKQLPVNDTQLPWEAEGNAFVGSKEDADIDPLAGGMSRDPGMSLFEAVNEPGSETEEELSPQEQRFLGDSAPKEEAPESPMARRMRERLEKLTAQQEYYANNPDARWSELYNIDPERASFDWNRIAPSVVQARLEHDAEIDKQIAGLSTQLRKDMLANGWTSTSPEFLERYGEIQELEASKYVKGDKNQFEKSVRLTDKEIDQKISAGKLEFDKEKEVSRVDEKAFDVTNKAMGDLMGEKYNMPAKYGHIASSLASAVSNPNNINEASIKMAVKAFIQSIDDSVVMAHEAMSFTDQSLIGRIRATLQGLVDDNVYSPDRLEEIWDNMNAYMETYKQGIENIAEHGKGFYTTYGGRNPAVFDSWVDLMTADANLPPKPDFSIVGPWWESQQTKANKKGGGSTKGAGSGGGLVIPPPKEAATGSYTYNSNDF